MILAELRGYDSAVHMLLHAQEVDLAVYNNLHDIILTELAPAMRRYAKLGKEVLGLDKLLYCDIEAPLDPNFSPPATFESAKQTILGGISILGAEYREIIAEALNNRWIDLADNIGKSTGAFCSSIAGSIPIFSALGPIRCVLCCCSAMNWAMRDMACCPSATRG